MFTPAKLSYMEAISRNTLQQVGPDEKITRRVLDDEEWVHAALVGSASYENQPVMLLTDRRFLHLPVGFLRSWNIGAQAPLTDVAGAELREKFPTPCCDVRLRSGATITMKVNRSQNVEHFLDAVQRLVRSGGVLPPPPVPQRRNLRSPWDMFGSQPPQETP